VVKQQDQWPVAAETMAANHLEQVRVDPLILGGAKHD